MEVISIKHQPDWVQQALNNGDYPFFFQIPIIDHHTRDNVTEIVGLGSKVERSRTGHKSTQALIDKFNESYLNKPLLFNHDINQAAGKLTRVIPGKPDEFIPVAQLFKPHPNPYVDAGRARIQQLLDEKVPMGMSYGGVLPKGNVTKEATGEFTYNVADLEFMEMTVSPFNALRSSDGTVKYVNQSCPNGICDQITQQIKNGPNLPEIEDLTELNQTAELNQSTGSSLNQQALDQARQCIQDGNVDLDTPWNRGSYEPYDETNKEDLENSCLGIDVTSTYDRYKYRVSIGGILYKQAVISVAANSPAGSEVYSAADELLRLIYQMEEPGEPATVTQANMFKCSNYGQFNNQNALTSVSCGSRLPNNTDGNNPIATQTNPTKNNGDDMMDDERLDKIEQTLDFVVKDIKERKEAEEQAKLEQAKQAEIQEALEKQETKHKEEMEAFKQATKEATEELINDTLKQILGDKAGIVQQSRHPENQDPGKPAPTQEEVPPVTIEQDSDKTITQQAAEKMSVEERYKSSVFAPPVVFGKVVEQGWTPDEFMNMVAKRNG